jgi:hypothetical protein
VKTTDKGAVPLDGDSVKLATGTACVTVTVCSDDVPVPMVFVAFKWIYHVPTPKEYVGFWDVLNWVTVLFPVLFRKYQTHDVGLFVDVSVKATDKGAVPLDGDSVKLAVGATGVVYLTITTPDPPVSPPDVELVPPPPPRPLVPAVAMAYPPPLPPPPEPPVDGQ